MLGHGKKSKSASAKVDTIIGQQTRIVGDVHFSGGLHVDGRIKGNIIAADGSASVLTVSEHGEIEGNVRVPTVILNGTVTGDVHSEERIELAARAKVTVRPKGRKKEPRQSDSWWRGRVLRGQF